MATLGAPPLTQTQWGSTFNEFTHAAPSLMAKLQMFAGVSDVQRVSQLDADVFDREIVSMMKVQLNRMFAFKPGVVETNQLEIDTALRGLVFVLSTLRNEPTPGMQLLDLKFGTIRKGIWGAPSVGQRLAYGLLTTVGPFLWVKILFIQTAATRTAAMRVAVEATTTVRTRKKPLAVQKKNKNMKKRKASRLALLMKRIPCRLGDRARGVGKDNEED
eukprot:g672.t1